MARLIATPVPKSETQINSLLGSCPKTKVGPELDKNSPFITRETKLNFENMMQNSLLIQEEISHAEEAEKGDPMDICDEQSKSIKTADIPLSNSGNTDVIASVYEEMEKRAAQIKALPSPERKRILGTYNAKTDIPMVTPSKSNNEASINQSPSSTNRFTQVHEKNFSKMPSIATHYAAQKSKKIEETQDEEVNRKRKDPDNMQSSVKKQKLAHSTQNGQVTKTKDICKKVEKSEEVVKPVVKKTYDRNRTTINNRSSMRSKGKNISQVEVQPSAKTSSLKESLKKPLSYIPYRGPVKSIIPNPEEQRKKEREELEKRKQAARNGIFNIYIRLLLSVIE
jgi:hypothetical protein